MTSSTSNTGTINVLNSHTPHAITKPSQAIVREICGSRGCDRTVIQGEEAAYSRQTSSLLLLGVVGPRSFCCAFSKTDQMFSHLEEQDELVLRNQQLCGSATDDLFVVEDTELGA
jgi:hypothetical protein